MFKIEIDENNYLTGNWATVGAPETWLNVEVLPDDFEDIDRMKCYKVVIKQSDEKNKRIMYEFDEDKYNKFISSEQENILNSIKTGKIAELSKACEKAIITGIEYGGKKFSYTLEDQNNLKGSIDKTLAASDEIPYHADGESFELYTREELVAIYLANETNLISQTVYNNQLKLYVQSLKTVEEVRAVTYGQALSGEYLDKYNEMIKQADKANSVSE